jgi:hypothetical protein
MNASDEAPDGSSECWVETSKGRTAERRAGMTIAMLEAGVDE